MNAEERALINQQLDVLMNIQYLDMPAKAVRGYQARIDAIRTSYDKAAAIRDDKDADAKLRKANEDVCNALAKGLPGITKGALSAASAFKKGDYINGSAAIMDICAAVAPIIGSLAAAGGPPGALIGALFSLVGQILAYFGPSQPSLKDQIKEMMLGLESEAKLRTMEAIGDSIDVYAGKLLTASLELPKILDLPLTTEAEAEEFGIKCTALNIGLTRDQQRMDTPAFNTWEVLEWLRVKDRQDLDKWPEVLGVFCSSYIKLISANVTFNLVPDRTRVYELLEQTRESNKTSPLPKGVRHDIHQLLIELQAMTSAYAKDWKVYNKKVLALMGTVDKAARYRGLFLHVGDGYLYAGSGERDVVKSNSWHYLRRNADDNYSGTGWIERMTSTPTWADADSPKQPYHCFLLRGTSWHAAAPSIEYRTVQASNPPTNAPAATGTFTSKKPEGKGSAPRVTSLPGLDAKTVVADLHAIPGGWENAPGEVWLYVATGSRIVELELNEKSVLECRGWQCQPAKSPITRVRSVYPQPVVGDPDGHLSTVFPAIEPAVRALTHYGGLADSPDIYVIRHDDYLHSYVPTPWAQYSGIEVDEQFLWVFTAGAFACATHTSIMKAAIDRQAGNANSKPRWITHSPKDLLHKLSSSGGGPVEPVAGGPALEGVRELAPCDDGTLMISAVTRSYDESGKMRGDDGPNMHTAECEVDVAAGTIEVGSWTKLAGGPASQIQKHAIYCWPLFDSLKARLSEESQVD